MNRRGPRILLSLAVLAPMLLVGPGSSGRLVADIDLGDVLLRSAIGSFFGLQKEAVSGLRDRHRLSIADSILTMYLARVGGLDHDRVAGLRSQGHGWGRIAQKLGIHPGTFNKMRKGLNPGKASKKDFEEAALGWFGATYHGVPPKDIEQWRRRGHSLPEVFIALNLAARSGKGVGYFLGQRRQGRNWHAIAAANGLSDSDLKQAVPPKGGKEFRGKKEGPGKPGGKGKGEGAPGGGPGKGQKEGGGPKGKGKGKGH